MDLKAVFTEVQRVLNFQGSAKMPPQSMDSKFFCIMTNLAFHSIQHKPFQEPLYYLFLNCEGHTLGQFYATLNTFDHS